ncbi:TPA: type I glyceraldehyde-3-phosphate dehydrogenase [Candidatus Uhrbacteria bacterium]|nr:type I glyceraldehyde-3-phosphate dehydrogenase [Candidatus Uhrbacteria bacterium]HCB56281.1 type I glyceraldehyde-3-phosphate dehydrogenase [Candidatus Uhrbacteria bacterium]
MLFIINLLMLRVAINGFGRIGRNTLKAGWDRKNLSFVAINDLTEPSILAHLLKYDSVFRTWNHEVSFDKNHLIIDGKKIPVYAQKDPAELPWKELQVDVVVESTGFFTTQEEAGKHLIAGAKKVVISAPSKDAPTYLMGVNHRAYKKTDKVVNNASCTTNSIAPVAQIIEEAFGIKKAMMTTIHSVTAGQNIVDGVPAERKPDLRRARAAMVNMVPTSTGAAIATTKVIPALKEKFDGISVRVPTLDVSLSDFTFVLKKKVTVEQINKTFKTAARSARWKGILQVTEDPIVSSDVIQTPYASIVDLEMTRVVDGDLVKVLAWYDNEWGYSVMLLNMVEHIGKA